MVDKLTDEERILAWKASWHPSFDGVAIVNQDGTFRSVNPQFCKLLGVTPAELIGHRFQDLTPPSIRKLDLENAELVKKGAIDFYLLPKKYQFASHEVDVVLLVTRAPPSSVGDFRFFVSRIMLDEKGALLTAHDEDRSGSVIDYPTSISSVVEFVLKYGKILITAGLVLGAFVLSLLGIV